MTHRCVIGLKSLSRGPMATCSQLKCSFIPCLAARTSLLKVDSQGYAMVMQGNSQSPDSAGSNRVSFIPGFAVGNVEEAWQCQQDRGYAPLTLKGRGKKTAGLAPGGTQVTPCDYEVPVTHGPPWSTPPLVKQTRVSSASSGTRRETLTDIEEDVFGRELPSGDGVGEKCHPPRAASGSVSSLPEGQDDKSPMEMDRPRAKSHVGITHQRPPQSTRGRRSLPSKSLPSKSLLISLSKDSAVII